MKFSVSKKNLSYLLSLASTISQKRDTMPLLANAKLQAQGKTLSVSATNLESNLFGSIDAEVTEPGGITVNSKVIFDIVRELPENKVEFESDDSSQLQVRSGKAHFKISGTLTDEFPALKGCSLSSPISVDSKKLYEMFDKTSYAVSSDETRHNINGVCIEMLDESKSNKMIRFISTDGNRIAIVDRPAEGIDVKSSVIVPKKGILELKKVLENSDGEEAKISIGKEYFTLQSGFTTLGVRLVDGSFPNYQKVLDSKSDTEISVSKELLHSSLKRVALVSGDNSPVVNFFLSGNVLSLSSRSVALGEADETLEVEKTGDDIKVGFSAPYLLDIMSSFSGPDTVKIKLSKDIGPGFFKSNDDSSYMAILMPMSSNN